MLRPVSSACDCCGHVILPVRTDLELGFSFTNQRLTSPNPTEFVGVENYTRLLGIGVLTLEPEREADGSLKQGADGTISYPRIRNASGIKR
ncbi:hypothetical protein [Agrobacterium radiobacter]|uniref:hypothetical protein n=1 Tax=Agrobacterium radiobacter TaxID=362 RepID=UPI003CE496F1